MPRTLTSRRPLNHREACSGDTGCSGSSRQGNYLHPEQALTYGFLNRDKAGYRRLDDGYLNDT